MFYPIDTKKVNFIIYKNDSLPEWKWTIEDTNTNINFSFDEKETATKGFFANFLEKKEKYRDFSHYVEIKRILLYIVENEYKHLM